MNIQDVLSRHNFVDFGGVGSNAQLTRMVLALALE
jgi:hypothetical protein